MASDPSTTIPNQPLVPSTTAQSASSPESSNKNLNEDSNEDSGSHGIPTSYHGVDPESRRLTELGPLASHHFSSLAPDQVTHQLFKSDHSQIDFGHQLHYSIDQHLLQLNEPLITGLFDQTDTVQVLEKILSSHLFGLPSHQDPITDSCHDLTHSTSADVTHLIEQCMSTNQADHGVTLEELATSSSRDFAHESIQSSGHITSQQEHVEIERSNPHMSLGYPDLGLPEKLDELIAIDPRLQDNISLTDSLMLQELLPKTIDDSHLPGSSSALFTDVSHTPAPGPCPKASKEKVPKLRGRPRKRKVADCAEKTNDIPTIPDLDARVIGRDDENSSAEKSFHSVLECDDTASHSMAHETFPMGSTSRKNKRSRANTSVRKKNQKSRFSMSVSDQKTTDPVGPLSAQGQDGLVEGINIYDVLPDMDANVHSDFRELDITQIDPAIRSLHTPNASQVLPSSIDDEMYLTSECKGLLTLTKPEISPNYYNISMSQNHPTQVDVHGAGAGGGAAAVLAANRLGSFNSNIAVMEEPIKTRYPLDVVREESAEPVPESYNPDQFRSFNRIHWTKAEEELLLAEVEMNWQRYDCMAQIMKRHGPNGTVSQTFADRTGVSLKDKAVNISSRWYRDNTELSENRRRAFARFRPKQLRGKPRAELPGMTRVIGSQERVRDS